LALLLIALAEVVKTDLSFISMQVINKQWEADWSKLGTIKIWRDAISQVVFTSGIGLGPLLYTSNCVAKQRIRYDYVNLIIGSLVSILATGILFAYIAPNVE